MKGDIKARIVLLERASRILDQLYSNLEDCKASVESDKSDLSDWTQELATLEALDEAARTPDDNDRIRSIKSSIRWTQEQYLPGHIREVQAIESLIAIIEKNV